MILRIMSCMTELGFRLYLYFKDPGATSSVLINTSSILVLTFSHSIGFVIGVSNLMFKIKFDPIVIPLGIYLIIKALMVPTFILFGSEGAINTLKVHFSERVEIMWNWVKAFKNFTPNMNVCCSNQVAPDVVREND